jgi:hypothetical protein
MNSPSAEINDRQQKSAHGAKEENFNPDFPAKRSYARHRIGLPKMNVIC